MKFHGNVARVDHRTIISIVGGIRPRMCAVLTIDNQGDRGDRCHGIARADGRIILNFDTQVAARASADDISLMSRFLVNSMREQAKLAARGHKPITINRKRFWRALINA